MTHAELLHLFVYEPDTGMLRKVRNARKPYPWRGIGKDARYLATNHAGKTYYLHSLVWFYHHGYLPVRIDHKDLDTRNNHIENLRPCSNAQNQYNSARKINNKSGAKGVVFHPKCVNKPWQAKIVSAGKVISLGYYASVEEASAAYFRGAEVVAKEFARKD